MDTQWKPVDETVRSILKFGLSAVSYYPLVK